MYADQRHSYLGDALTHLSFGLLSVNTPAFHPLLFIGPVTNYFFLRFVGGDKENEAGQEERYSQFDPTKDAQLTRYKQTKNAFWPALAEFGNSWTWIVLGAGAGAVVVEKVAREIVSPAVL
jgi:steroid 5-alpha reductase family enzyme